ncbi:ABC transporter substrate-binding protein [Belnapia mucosa]|uniref:ABC transporter substrate-binding protein n=1 Tax=Belnapia mucosa TaxID=2804532 RepID=UPI0038B348A1
MARRPLLAAAAASLAAPRLAAAQGGRVLKFIPQSNLSMLDPVWSTAYVVRNHGLMVFDMLYGMDGQFRIQPQMAEGHTVSDDGLTWTIRLREGLRFHDGAPVLARDCIASIRRFCARDGLGQSLIAATEELAPADDHTIRFRLKQRFPLLTYALGKPGSPICVIMPQRLAETDPFRQVTEMVGSGPFRFLPGEHIAGARAAYARFEEYVPRPGPAAVFTAGGKIAHFDRVEWLVMPDPATAAAALRAGEADWLEAPTFDLLPMLGRDRRLTLTQLDPPGFIGTMRFNQLHPPFNNPAIRRAVLPALSQADYMTAVAGTSQEYWRDGVGYFAPGTPMASDAGMEALTAPRDLDKARRALAAAGYKGETVVLLAPADFQSLKALGDIGADLLTKIGFKVDYQVTDWGTQLQRLIRQEPPDQGGWSVFHTTWADLDHLDPAVHQYMRGNGKAGRPGWPDSPRVEALRDAWLAEETPEGQRRLAADLQRQAFEDLPYIPLGQLRASTAHKREITGLTGGFAIFWGVRRA